MKTQCSSSIFGEKSAQLAETVAAQGNAKESLIGGKGSVEKQRIAWGVNVLQNFDFAFSAQHFFVQHRKLSVVR